MRQRVEVELEPEAQMREKLLERIRVPLEEAGRVADLS